MDKITELHYYKMLKTFDLDGKQVVILYNSLEELEAELLRAYSLPECPYCHCKISGFYPLQTS